MTNFRSSFEKITKIPVLELVVNKIGDTFLDYRFFTADFFDFFVDNLQFDQIPVNSRRNFTEIQDFPGISNGNSGSRESREFPNGWPW